MTTPPAGSSFSGVFDFPKLERVVHGPGTLSQVADEIDRLGGRRAFVVTSRSIAGKTDFLDRLQDGLGNRFVGSYREMPAHTPQDHVLLAAEAAKGADADILISLGGGSSVDAAKMVALCLAEGITRDDQFIDHRVRIVDGVSIPTRMTGRAIPQVAIPTTLSGGEFSGLAGCTETTSGSKEQYRHQDLAPKVVVQDPELARATPAWLWGSTGMRAVDHCVEALYSTNRQPFADALAVEALGLLSTNLVAAASDPNDLVARGRCQLASWLSLYALNNVRVGLSHAIGHQLGGRCGVPHGVTSCLTLAAVMDFNREACADRLAKAARAMGVDVRGMDDDGAARAASDRVRLFVRELGIKDRLRDWNVTEEDLGPVAKGTMNEFLLTNPRPVKGSDEVKRLLRQIF